VGATPARRAATSARQIADNPPDILLTNFMMLELILTRFEDIDRRVVDHCRGWNSWCWTSCTPTGAPGRRRGHAGAPHSRAPADRAAGVHRHLGHHVQHRREDDRNQTVASVASLLFGAQITELDVIGETLERVTNPAPTLRPSSTAEGGPI
jgi:hypothetical protein